jgi:SRSO17 transposase
LGFDCVETSGERGWHASPTKDTVEIAMPVPNRFRVSRRREEHKVIPPAFGFSSSGAPTHLYGALRSTI